MINPLDRQVGGNHYKNLGMQPIEFAMMNQWDAAAFSALKYLSRYRFKNGVEDLKKARHFVELRRELIHFRFAPYERTPMARYLMLNKLEGLDAAVLNSLERWVISGETNYHIVVLDGVDLLITEASAPQNQLSLLP